MTRLKGPKLVCIQGQGGKSPRGLQTVDSVMAVAAGLAEALSLAQEKNVSRKERQRAQEEIRGYVRKLNKAGINAYFLDGNGVQVKVDGPRPVHWIMLSAKRKMGIREVAALLARGESLEGKLTPLMSAVLVMPVNEPSG